MPRRSPSCSLVFPVVLLYVIGSKGECLSVTDAPLQLSHVFLRRLCKWLLHCFPQGNADLLRRGAEAGGGVVGCELGCVAGVQREGRGGTKEKKT